MVSKKEQKENIGWSNKDTMREVVKAVLKDKMPTCEAAQEYNVSNATLQQYAMKSKDVTWEEDLRSKDKV